MNAKNYIQVIVPLKLDWEPVYSVPEGLEVAEGDRVSVIFSGKEYISVVSRTGITPDSDLREDSIHSILDKVAQLPPVSPRELRFWRTMASYYLCTVGEVYNSVYFRDRIAPKKWTAKDRSAITSEPILSPSQETVYHAALDAFDVGKTVLLQGVSGSGKKEVYLKLAANTIRQGKSVLYLVPDISVSKALEERVASVFPDVMPYHSGLTAAKRRDVILEARTGNPVFVLGTRSALWIPFEKLGLIIVDQEQDSFYKQDSPAPRYHTRETAIMLASIYGAKVILGSTCPSLESVYNSETGLFTRLELNQRFNNSPEPEVMLVDISAEKKKRGMSGSFSLKFLARLKDAVDGGEKALVICRAKAAVEQVREELENIFPGALGKSIMLDTPFAVKTIPYGEYAVIAVLLADGLLGREDFRSDERAMQMFTQLRGKTGLLVIQTKESRHPVFSQAFADTLLAERKAVGYPPFTRMVKLELKDSDENRQKLRARFLGNRLKEILRPFSDPLILGPEKGEIRVFFKRNKNLTAGKQALYKEVTSFEQQYSCHIIIDVDPV